MPHPFPILELDPSVTNIEDFEYKHFKLINYTHHPKLKMEMAVWAQLFIKHSLLMLFENIIYINK